MDPVSTELVNRLDFWLNLVATDGGWGGPGISRPAGMAAIPEIAEGGRRAGCALAVEGEGGRQ
jgi:hypothetical protein